jgi:hypothetical protein
LPQQNKTKRTTETKSACVAQRSPVLLVGIFFVFKQLYMSNFRELEKLEVERQVK